MLKMWTSEQCEMVCLPCTSSHCSSVHIHYQVYWGICNEYTTALNPWFLCSVQYLKALHYFINDIQSQKSKSEFFKYIVVLYIICCSIIIVFHLKMYFSLVNINSHLLNIRYTPKITGEHPADFSPDSEHNRSVPAKPYILVRFFNRPGRSQRLFYKHTCNYFSESPFLLRSFTVAPRPTVRNGAFSHKIFNVTQV